MKNDTLISFIKAECANLTSTNLCIGLDVFGERFMNQDKCLILRKKRCEYFKKCVLPLAKLMGCYDRIFKEYIRFDKTVDQSEEARFCECGEELKPRERFCERCRKKRRLESKREYQKNYRVHEVQLT